MTIYSPTEQNINKASELIKSRNLVVMPTETVYGLAANAMDPEAIQKIYQLKGRPADNPLIVHVASIRQIEDLAYLPENSKSLDYFQKLATLWPAPLSIILKKKPCLPDCLTGNKDSVAIRIPKHPVALALLTACGLPLAAPSANRSNRISPTKASHVEEEFLNENLFILDGGDCEIGLESTVISLLNDEPKILRPGNIDREFLENLLNIELSDQLNQEDQGLSPGLSLKHYSPQTAMYFADDPNLKLLNLGKNIARLRFNSNLKASNIEQLSYVLDISLSNKGDLNEVAKNLFAALKMIDSHQLDAILIDSCPREKIGAAIMNRLERAVTKIAVKY